MKKKIRKKRPEPPWYFYFDTDNCYRCKNKNGCGGCKILKRYITSKQHQKRRKVDFLKIFDIIFIEVERRKSFLFCFLLSPRAGKTTYFGSP